MNVLKVYEHPNTFVVLAYLSLINRNTEHGTRAVAVNHCIGVTANPVMLNIPNYES